MNLLLSWLVLSVAVGIASAFLPGFRVKGVGGAIFTAALFGVLNTALGWLLFLAFGFATLGLGFLLAFVTRLVVDAIMLKVTDAMTDRLTIDGFGWAIAAAAVMSGVGTVGEWLLHSV